MTALWGWIQAKAAIIAGGIVAALWFALKVTRLQRDNAREKLKGHEAGEKQDKITDELNDESRDRAARRRADAARAIQEGRMPDHVRDINKRVRK